MLDVITFFVFELIIFKNIKFNSIRIGITDNQTIHISAFTMHLRDCLMYLHLTQTSRPFCKIGNIENGSIA